MSTLIPSTSYDNILQKVQGVRNKIKETLNNPATTMTAKNSDTSKPVQRETNENNFATNLKRNTKTTEDDDELKEAINIFNEAVQKKKREIQKKKREQQNSSTQTKTEQQNSSQKKKKVPLLLTRAQILKLKKKKEKEKKEKERQNSNNNDTNSRETKKSNDLFGDYEKRRNMSDEEMIRLFKQKMEKQKMEKQKMLRTKRLQNKSMTQPNRKQIKTTLKRVDDSPNVVNQSELKNNSHTFNTIGHDTIGKQDMRHLMNERQNSNNNDPNSRVTKKSNHLFDDYNKRFNRSVEEVLQSFNQKLKRENMLRKMKQRRRYILGGRSDGDRSDSDESDFDF